VASRNPSYQKTERHSARPVMCPMSNRRNAMSPLSPAVFERRYGPSCNGGHRCRGLGIRSIRVGAFRKFEANRAWRADSTAAWPLSRRLRTQATSARHGGKCARECPNIWSAKMRTGSFLQGAPRMRGILREIEFIKGLLPRTVQCSRDRRGRFLRLNAFESASRAKTHQFRMLEARQESACDSPAFG
jgi:hypothetical protein